MYIYIYIYIYISVYSSLGKQVYADSGLVGSPRSVGDQISIDVSLKTWF